MVSEEQFDLRNAARRVYGVSDRSAQVPYSKLLGAILLLLVGVGSLTFVGIYLARDLSLWVFGTRVEASVADLWAEATGEASDGTLTFRYYVQYEFVTPRGRLVSGTSSVGPHEWMGLGTGSVRASKALGDSGQHAPVYYEQSGIPQEGIGGLEEGGTISVVYFAPLPQHNRLEDSRLIPVLACAYVPLVMVGLFSLMGGWRTIRPALARQDRA